MKSLTRLAVVALLGLLTACDEIPTFSETKQAIGLEKREGPKKDLDKRIPILADNSQITPDPSMKDNAVVVPTVVANSQWPQHQGTPRGVIGNVKFAAEPKLKASEKAGEGTAGSLPYATSPVVGDGLVFAMDAAGAISAHQAADITQVRWTSCGLCTTEHEEVVGGGLAYQEGRLFITSGRGIVAALEAATGKELWRQTLGIPLRSAPKIEAGRVLALGVDNQLFALDGITGALLWSKRGIEETAGYLNAVAPAAGFGVAVAPYSSGELAVMQLGTGEELWKDTLIISKRTQASALFSGIGADPVLSEDRLYATSSGGVTASFHLPTGQRVWEQPFSSVNSLWLAGDFLYMLTTDHQLVSLNAPDGRVKWVQPLRRYANEKEHRDPLTWSGPVMAGGFLWLAGANGQMLKIDPTDGKTLEVLEIPEGIYTAPVISSGRMYLADRSGKLHQFE